MQGRGMFTPDRSGLRSGLPGRTIQACLARSRKRFSYPRERFSVLITGIF